MFFILMIQGYLKQFSHVQSQAVGCYSLCSPVDELDLDLTSQKSASTAQGDNATLPYFITLNI